MLNATNQTLTFNSKPISFITANGKEYFLAKNVCEILELKNVSQALSRVQIGDIISNDTLTTSGIQKMSYVDEFALYDLVMASKKPEAIEFKKWAYAVLQEIRKTGKFEIQQAPQIDGKFLLEIAQQMIEKENLIKLQSTKIEVLEIENTQKEEVIEQFIDAKEHKNYTQTADIVGMPQKKFLEYLRANGYVEKAGRRPTVKSKNLKIIETKWSDKGYKSTHC
jgi:prophage antirepressor-like protein